MLARRSAVERGERVIDPHVAQVATPEREADRGPREQRVQNGERLLRVAEEARVVHGHRRASAELFGERQVRRAVRSRGFSGRQGQRADRAPAGDQRNDQIRAQLKALQELELLLVRRDGRDPLVGDFLDQLGAGRPQYLGSAL
jgi:hypothetical protein